MATPAGMLSLDELRTAVESGSIDTVVVAFTDPYGRAMGKRFDARFFVEDGFEHGTHACDYLLTVDMEMNPVPGYRFASWERGYGDVHLVPDPATLRAAVDPARQLGRINRSESWRRVLQSADAAELAEFGDSQAHWLATLLWHPTFQT